MMSMWKSLRNPSASARKFSTPRSAPSAGRKSAPALTLPPRPIAFPRLFLRSFSYCFPIGLVAYCLWESNRRLRVSADKVDVWQGTLALMVLKTLESLGSLHGYGIARRIEQTSGDLLSVNYGTLYPALLKLEQEGAISAEWGTSDNNRKARYYKLTRAGRKQLQREAHEWAETTAILARFLHSKPQPS